MRGDGIYRLSSKYPEQQFRGVNSSNGWPGARGFRDFFRLPPAQENRGQPADPAPAANSTRYYRRKQK